MADDLIPILTRFHREVVLPDIQRVVGNTVEASERRLRDEMQTGFDALAQRLERVEIQLPMLVSGIKRVEERLEALEDRMGSVERRLDGIDKKLEKLALKSELLELKARVEGLQQQVRALEDGSMRSSDSMGSRSENAPPVRLRARPSARLTARLRRGKTELRRERERMSLPDKVRQVLELQRFVYPLLARRRTLEPWERPWEIEP